LAKSKCLTLSQIKARTTGYFFSKDTMKFFRGTKLKVKCDKISGTHYIKADSPHGTSWYKFNSRSGDINYIAEEKVPEKLKR